MTCFKCKSYSFICWEYPITNLLVHCRDKCIAKHLCNHLDCVISNLFLMQKGLIIACIDDTFCKLLNGLIIWNSQFSLAWACLIVNEKLFNFPKNHFYKLNKAVQLIWSSGLTLFCKINYTKNDRGKQVYFTCTVW